MNESILQNILIFMERVQCTGKECGAWTETYQAVASELQVRRTPAPTGREAVEGDIL